MFRDLDDFLEEPLQLTIRGRTFTFPGSISARTGLQLQRMHQLAVAAHEGELDADTPAITKENREHLFDEMLGEAKEQLLDYATQREYELVSGTLFNVHMYGREVAEMVWNSQGETLAPSATRSGSPRSRPRGSRGGSTKSKPRARKARPGGKS